MDDRAESAAPNGPPPQGSKPADLADPGAAARDPESVKEDPSMDEDVHEAHRMKVPTAPMGH